MDDYGIVGIIISALCTGGLTWLFTIKYTRKQAEADAMKSVQDVYQEMITDLRDEKKEISEENKDLREQVRMLTERMGQIERDCQENAKQIESLQPYLCYVKNCTKRICTNNKKQNNVIKEGR